MGNKQIQDAYAAKDFVLKHLKENNRYHWRQVSPINNGRYWLVEGSNGDLNIAIIFKKEWFFNYGKMAKEKTWVNKDNVVESGIGDSINKEDLRTMIRNNITTIYNITKTGDIYQIDIRDFLIFSHDWTNKEGKEVRSISVHKYGTVNK